MHCVGFIFSIHSVVDSMYDLGQCTIRNCGEDIYFEASSNEMWYSWLPVCILTADVLHYFA